MIRKLGQRVSFLAILGAAASLACNLLMGTATPADPAPVATAGDGSVPEMIVLNEVLQKMDGCQSDMGVRANDQTYTFSCRNSADTHYTVAMLRFENKAEARSQFDRIRAGISTHCFHGYDLYETKSQNPNNQYIVQEQLGWQAGQWIFSVDASFDYGYFHFTALGFAEALYASSLEHGLFPAGMCPEEDAASPALSRTSSSP